MKEGSIGSLLNKIWRSLEKESDEINLELMVSHWAPIEEVRILSGDEKHKVRRIWERASSLSKVPTGYREFFRSLDYVRPPEGYEKIDETFSTRTRLFLGSGFSGWETPLVTLLKPFSVPWVPGSSLKGAMRSVAEERGIDSSALFGDKERKGNIIVVGGFIVPTEEEVLGVDVMTPHYKPYYEGKDWAKYPHEYLDPVPIKFLVVRENVPFRFIVMTLRGNIDEMKDILKETLVSRGLGGKRSAGYGLFKGPV